MWDNNTLPLFRAVSAPTARSRECRARAALEWMAALGSDRRAWMTERARESGFTLEGLVALDSPSSEPAAGPGAGSSGAGRSRPGGPVAGYPGSGKPVAVIPGPEAEAAALLLIGAMLRIRSARSEPGQPELVRALTRALEGAGTDILAAGACRGRRARGRAFRGLAEEWVGRGGPAAAPVFDRILNRLDRLDPAQPREG